LHFVKACSDPQLEHALIVEIFQTFLGGWFCSRIAMIKRYCSPIIRTLKAAFEKLLKDLAGLAVIQV
jgi:hypothetical protein